MGILYSWKCRIPRLNSERGYKILAETGRSPSAQTISQSLIQLLYYSHRITLLKYAVWCSNIICLFGGKNNCVFLLCSLLHHFLAGSVYTLLALDSFGLDVCKSTLPGHCSFHPLTVIWITKKASVQEACFWQGFRTELKHRNTVYFSVLSLLLRGTYLIELKRIYPLFIRFS